MFCHRCFRQADRIKYEAESRIKASLVDSSQASSSSSPSLQDEHSNEEKVLSLDDKEDHAISSSSEISALEAKLLRDAEVENTCNNMSKDEVINYLRVHGEAATLFGESDNARFYRFKKLFHRKIEAKSSDNIDESSKVCENENDGNVSGLFKDSSNQSSSSLEKTNEAKNESDNEGDDMVIYSQIPNYPPEKVIYKYFHHLIEMWGKDLSLLNEAEKSTRANRSQRHSYEECRDHIRPLFKMCKRKEVPADILLHLIEIVKFAELGDFRAAHDWYIRAAIGNSAWPIGLTMVGIHERSGRERISTSKVAHVMNNELQRKFLTAVKRLLTYAQTKRPDVPPSMKVFV